MSKSPQIVRYDGADLFAGFPGLAYTRRVLRAAQDVLELIVRGRAPVELRPEGAVCFLDIGFRPSNAVENLDRRLFGPIGGAQALEASAGEGVELRRVGQAHEELVRPRPGVVPIDRAFGGFHALVVAGPTRDRRVPPREAGACERSA